MTSLSNKAVLILAAGSSSRMGQSKQLLEYKGSTLLSLSVNTALQTGCKVCVVIGANDESHRKELEGFDIDLIYNPLWEKGMGNSLKYGVQHLVRLHADLEAIIIMVCDQPKLKPDILFDLLNKYKEGSGLVGCYYGEVTGVPALFSREYFDELLSIEDSQGARAVINKHNTRRVPFPEGDIDVDTPEDYKRLNKL